MQTQTKKSDFSSSPSKIRNRVSKGGCLVVLLAQYMLTQGLTGLPDLNVFAILLLSEFLFILALRELIATNFARDILDLTCYSTGYLLTMYGAYKFKLGFYQDMVGYANPLASFFFLVAYVRFLWVVKVPNTEIYYSWPFIGPVGLFFARKTREPIVRQFGHSLIVYAVILGVFALTFFCKPLPHQESIKQILAGLLAFVLFFTFFRSYMQDNIAMVEENIEHRSKEEQLAALIAAVLAKAEGKLDPELVEIMCLFSEMDKSTQSAMAASIRALHQKIVAGEVPSNKNKKPEDE